MVDLQHRVTDVTPPHPPRRSRERVRNLFVGLVSLVVVAAAVLYVAAPSDVAVRFAVDEVASPQSYDTTVVPSYTLVSARQQARPRKTRPTEVVYGKVTSRGVPVSRITLRFTGATRATRGQGATVRIARANVTYRAVLHLKPGRYKITLTLRAGKKVRTARLARTLRTKHNYRVAAAVRARGVITFLPVTTY